MTQLLQFAYLPVAISIHTALAGCDVVFKIALSTGRGFQSTQPSQAVTCDCTRGVTYEEFQSTQPSQAVTNRPVGYYFRQYISIHTALAGCDHHHLLRSCYYNRFQSTQPSQAVTLVSMDGWERLKISIHTALAGCDTRSGWASGRRQRFQSTQPSQAVTGFQLGDVTH